MSDDGPVYLPDHMGRDRTFRASDLAPVTGMPDPEDMYGYLFPS